MLREIETEFKYLVGHEAFQKLLHECSKKYPYLQRNLQVNYYYDTEDNALNGLKTTVRIRQCQSSMKLQIKMHRTTNAPSAVSDEYSDDVTELPLAIKIPDVQNAVVLKGVLVSERSSFPFGTNSVICFDANMYLGVCDYEIEIETAESDRQEALTVIDFLHLPHRPVASKSERFFKRLETLKNG